MRNRPDSARASYNKGRFAIIGDVQPTSKVEFWRKSNAQERVQLIQQITMEVPDFLAIVGDLVFCGSSAANWTAFDTLATPCMTHVCRSSHSWGTMTMGLCGKRL